MQMLRQLLTHNWLLKLVSLIVAGLLWLTITSETTSEIGLTVPVEFRNVAPDLEIAGDTTNSVEIRLRGTAAILRQIAPQDISAVIDLAGAEPGEKVYPLTPQQIRTPFGMEVVRIVPSRVKLEFERTASKLVPVTVTLRGEPPAGFTIHGVTATPAAVEVRGPESRVRRLQSLATAPVDIDRTGGIMQLVDLEVMDPLLRLTHLSPIGVRIEVAEIEIERRLTVRPDPLMGEHGLTVRPSQLVITVKGPRSSIQKLDPTMIRFGVSTENLAPGTHPLTPRIMGLVDGVEVLSVTPETVNVVVRRS